jgi:hypothetical protein
VRKDGELLDELEEPASLAEGGAALLVDRAERDGELHAGRSARALAEPVDADDLRAKRVHLEVARQHAVRHAVDDAAEGRGKGQGRGREGRSQ